MRMKKSGDKNALPLIANSGEAFDGGFPARRQVGEISPAGPGIETVSFRGENAAALLAEILAYIDELRCVRQNHDDAEAREAKSAILGAVKAFGPAILTRSCLVIRDAKNGRLHKLEICYKGMETIGFSCFISNEKKPSSFLDFK